MISNSSANAAMRFNPTKEHGGARLSHKDMQKDIVTRALELARTGKFCRVSQITPVLTREGYTHVHEHFLGLTLRRTVQAACYTARGICPKHVAAKPKRKPSSISKLPRSMQIRSRTC